MPTRLTRYYGLNHLHFLTCTCFHRIPFLNTPQRRDLCAAMLEEVRQRYRFVVIGYVIMPEHFHLLVSEPEIGNPTIIMKILKQESAYRLGREDGIRVGSLPGGHIWQKRFYDFNVWSERKRTEKLRYIHRNPVRRGLVSEPDQWRWSSYRSYAYGEVGLGRVNCQEWKLEIKMGVRQRFAGAVDPTHSRKARE